MVRATKQTTAAPKQPTLAQDPDGWERSWQDKTDKLYRASLSRIPSILPDVRRLDSSIYSDEGSQQIQALEHKRLVELQNDIREYFSRKSAEDDFPALWKAAGPDVRRKHYFEAMTRVCEIPDMETQRQFCPEVTWKAFEADGGQGYLDLLLLLSRERPENQYTNIENKLVNSCFEVRTSWDTTYSVTQDLTLYMQRLYIMRRMLFISLVAWNVILSYYGRAETYVSHAAQRARNLSPDVGEAFGLSNAEIKRTNKENKKIFKQHGHTMCSRCDKYDFQLAEGEKFKSCARCNTIGRTTLYCSRECQLEDWKSGSPPHKTICGKPLAQVSQQIASAGPSSSGREPRFPPAENGFVRSPALQYTLRALEENPQVDYAFARPSSEDTDYGVIFTDSTGRLFFRMMLNRAVTTGDATAVQRMYEFLKSYAEKPGNIGVAALKKQLKNEYGVDVADK